VRVRSRGSRAISPGTVIGTTSWRFCARGYRWITAISNAGREVGSPRPLARVAGRGPVAISRDGARSIARAVLLRGRSGSTNNDPAIQHPSPRDVAIGSARASWPVS
jgi:hypothetical protein